MHLIPLSSFWGVLYSPLLVFLLALLTTLSLNRVSQAQTITYDYDETTGTNGKGRLTSVSDSSGTAKFSYDAMGRATQKIRIVDGTTYSTSTDYDPLGRLETVGYPDSTTVTYEYNGPVLSRVYEGTTNYAQYTGYNALAQPGRLTLGNNVVTDYSYSNTGNADCSSPNFRLCKITTGYSTNPKYQDLKYGYDNIGNITSITDLTNANNNQTFSYQDDLDRLTSATGPYGAGGATATVTYAYDQIGNMICNSQISACTGASPNYTYPASGTTSVRPHAVTTAGSNSYTYDINGNMIGGAGRTIAYTPDNRPSGIITSTGTTTFVYDGSGDRVKKTVAGSTTVYIGKLYECKAGTCSKYIFAAGNRIALKPVGSGGEIYYYHGDHLGSSSVMTDGSGAKVQDLAYFPYGQTRVNTGSINVNHRYTSQEMDDSTGLYFYNARYYDPVLGRFIQADTIVPNPADPEAFNRYSYVRNNPLKYTDPSGHVGEDIDPCSIWGGGPGCPAPSRPQPNNPCVAGNCGPLPPPGSGGNPGNTCPAGGCAGQPGTITDVTDRPDQPVTLIGNGNMQTTIVVNTPVGVQQKTATITIGASAGAGKSVTGGFSLNFGWDERQGWVPAAFSFSFTYTVGGGAYAGVGAAFFASLGWTNAPSVNDLNGWTNTIGSSYNAAGPVMFGSTPTIGLDQIINDSGSVLGNQFSFGGTWGPRQPVDFSMYRTWTQPIYQMGYQTGSPASTNDWAFGGSSVDVGYDFFDYPGGGW